ncbi:hypothetical protein BROUX41_006340 [Berkeleyomyces rouxiae]|uniref:uncharacterized protein n=1 Tax=Berkeleyomyces rouxiae TaxID=2035830 RepID=UPI003B815616
MMSGRLGGRRSGGQTKIRVPGSTRMAMAGPRRVGNSMSPEYMWEILESAILDIHKQQSSKLVFEQLYRAAYNLAVMGQGEFLYNQICELEAQWLQTEMFPLLRAQLGSNHRSQMLGTMCSVNERYTAGGAFLGLLRDLWSTYGTAAVLIADVCMYLDRSYIEQNNKPTVYETAMALFRDHILKARVGDDTVMQLVLEVVLDQISMERNGQVIDRLRLKSCVSMLNGLAENEHSKDSQQLYVASLVPSLIKDSRDFYKNECKLLLQNGDTPAWIAHCNKRIEEETDRYHTYLHKSTLPEILDVLHDEMIRAPLADFIDMESSGLYAMIDNKQFDQIRKLYELESRVSPETSQFNKSLRAKVLQMGKVIEKVLEDTDFSAPPPKATDDGSSAPTEAKQQTPNAAAQQTAAAMMWVDKVLELEGQFTEIVKQCCDSKIHISAAVSRGFSGFINGFARCAEFISLYIDESFRKGIRGKEESEIETLLDQMIKVIRYIDQKDLFERYYQKHLARRLLFKKSESMDTEKLMISRMKHEFGNSYTSKFESMFRDLELSSGLTSRYRESMAAEKTASGVELSMTILTNGAWPLDILGQTKRIGKEDQLIACEWPAHIQPLIDSVNQFYLGEHSGRTLSWVGGLGEADITCTFPAIPGKPGALGRERRYELHVPVHGMLVLDLFNNIPHSQALTFEEILERTNIPHSDLVRTLMSLSVAPKCRMLLKEPTGKSVKPGDKFAFNTMFVSKTTRIKAPVVTASAKVESDAERKSTEQKNDQSRGHLIDAAIVRIMKQRKELGHTPLVTEVIKQMASRFSPDVSLVKKRIEDLLSRDYIERIEDMDTPTYRYLA